MSFTLILFTDKSHIESFYKTLLTKNETLILT